MRVNPIEQAAEAFNPAAHQPAPDVELPAICKCWSCEEQGRKRVAR